MREFTSIREPRILQFGLFACLTGAVLAFGGTEPISWAAIEILALLVFGLALWRRQAWSPETAWPWKGPALLLAYAAFQAIITRADHQSQQQVLRLLTSLCVFYLAAFTSGNRRGRAFLVFGLLGLGLFEALYGLMQYVSGWQQIFFYKKVFYVAQATGTYLNPNHFAGLLELILPLCFAVALDRLGRSSRRGDALEARAGRLLSGERVVSLAFYLFLCLVLYAGILYSRSRMGILSATAALVATWALWMSSPRWRSGAALAALLLVAGVCVVGLWIGIAPVIERYQHIGPESLSRLAVWRDSLALIHAHPWRGTGPGSFADAYTRVQTTLVSRTVDHAHNDYLELAAEWGLPGAALLFGLIVLVLARAIWSCFQRPQSMEKSIAVGTSGGILALLLHSAADFNLQIPANALLLSAVLGMAHSVSGPGLAPPRRSQRLRPMSDSPRVDGSPFMRRSCLSC